MGKWLLNEAYLDWGRKVPTLTLTLTL